MRETLSDVRHLTERQALAALSRGAVVEQLLAIEPGKDLVWLSLGWTGQQFVLTRHHVRDDGSDDFWDVYEFSPVSDHEELGEGHSVADFDDARNAVTAAVAHGAQPNRWVNEGVVQDEYGDARSSA